MNERRFSKTVRANVALEWRAKSAGHMKTTQCSKIRELRQALVKAGHLTLDQQAESLGLARSTAWAILRGNHKHSGLSAATIKRMLSSQQLPPPARKILLEYVEEKLAGAYGHNQRQLRKFRERLGANGFWADGKEAARRSDAPQTFNSPRPIFVSRV
jgi:transcriptional regulator with XRE-family HTH domain